MDPSKPDSQIAGARSFEFDKSEADAAYKALIARPKFTIRLRIAAGFLLTFVFICIIIISAFVFIEKLDSKQRFLEKAGNLAFEIQQARRYEKNYFLYGTNLYDALTHTNTAAHLLVTYETDFRNILGDHAFQETSDHLKRYQQLLEDLHKLPPENNPEGEQQRQQAETELRQFGSMVVLDASNAIDQERLRIHNWIYSAKVIAITALLFILIFEAYIATFITRQIYRRFRRFEKYAQRIAEGDFSPITPAKKYKDEFTGLAIAINQMLNELHKREEQLIQARKMAAVGTLTAGIAHEINNPLNNISITAETLIDEYDEWTKEEQLKMLKDIFTQVERAGATVANLLDFTRRDKTSFESLSLIDVIESTTKFVKNEIALNDITLEMNLDKNLPYIKGNQHNLQQVFLNLFLNAIQAMPHGGRLIVKATTEEERICIIISDTGIGIPKENLEKIFDPFFTTKEVGQGTGLGLSVSFGIIEKHRGSIQAESQLGKGTSFTICFPVAESADIED